MAIKLSHELVEKIIEGWSKENEDAIPPRWRIKYQWELVDDAGEVLVYTTHAVEFVSDTITIHTPNLYVEAVD